MFLFKILQVLALASLYVAIPIDSGIGLGIESNGTVSVEGKLNATLMSQGQPPVQVERDTTIQTTIMDEFTTLTEDETDTTTNVFTEETTDQVLGDDEMSTDSISNNLDADVENLYNPTISFETTITPIENITDANIPIENLTDSNILALETTITPIETPTDANNTPSDPITPIENLTPITNSPPLNLPRNQTEYSDNLVPDRREAKVPQRPVIEDDGSWQVLFPDNFIEAIDDKKNITDENIVYILNDINLDQMEKLSDALKNASDNDVQTANLTDLIREVSYIISYLNATKNSTIKKEKENSLAESILEFKKHFITTASNDETILDRFIGLQIEVYVNLILGTFAIVISIIGAIMSCKRRKPLYKH